MATTIKIGHASSSEHGTITGTSGDQTGREVRIDKNYPITRLNPSVVLRPKTKALAEKSAKACEDACANDKIGYDQYGRNTLEVQAKKVNYDLSKITTACETDCSAFMTLCAVAGGATFNYATSWGNAPVCSTMRKWFTQNDDYKALTADKYRKQTDFLKRGDILVAEGSHTVMVLENGKQIVDTDGLTISVSLSSVSQTDAKISIKVYKTEDGKKKLLKDSKELKLYKWSYTIESLNRSKGAANSEKLTISSATTKVTVKHLVPNNSYMLKVTAKNSKEKAEFISPNVIFTTKWTLPTAVKDLVVKYNTDRLVNKKCTIAFSAPTSWGKSTLTKCYRVYLILNGNIVSYDDALIKPASADVRKEITLKKLAKDNAIKYNDTIQIGILPGLKDGDKFIFEDTALKCSEPIVLEPFLTPVNKIFIKIKKEFKQAVLHNNR